MITLQSIELTNFMCVDYLYIDFPENSIISITGENGQGKSSLIYAIAFALTGYRRGDSYRDYVKVGADKAHIVLNARFKGYPIYYDIELKGNNKTGNPINKKVIYKDVEYLNSDYNRFIKENELEYLESLMFLFQGNNDIIDAKPSERANTLKKLFRFEFNDIVERLKEKQESSKDSSIELNATIKELQSREFKIQPLVRETPPALIKDWENEIIEINNQLNKIGNVSEEDLIKCENKINEIEKSVQSTKSKINGINIDIENNFKKKIEEKTKEIEGINIDEINNLIEILNEDRINIDNEIESISSQLKDQESSLKLKKYELNQISSQIQISKTGVCHSCGQPISKDHVDQLEDKYKNLEIEYYTLEENIKKLNKGLSNIKSRKNKNDSNISFYRGKLSLFENNTRQIENYKERINDLNELLKSNEKYLESLNSSRTMYWKELNNLEKIKPILEQKEELRKRKDTLNTNISNAQAVIISNKEKRNINSIVKKDEEEVNKKIEELTLKTNNLLLDINNTKTSIDIFENLFPNYILLRACNQLEEYINSIVQRVFPSMSVSLRQSRSGVSFFYRFDEDGDELPVCIASGAQKSILSLAYKVALSKMYGLETICLDEIDASMSEGNSRLIYDFLMNLEGFNQILFITHKVSVSDYIKDRTDKNLIMFEVKDGEYNQI